MKSKKDLRFKIFAYTFLVIIAIISLAPVYVLLINTTRTSAEIQQGFSLIPGTNFGQNFYGLMTTTYVDFVKSLFNSIIIAFPATALMMYFSGLTAYGFAQFDFKGKKFLFNLILFSMMIPSQLILIGFYQVCYWLGLLDSFIPLIITGVANMTSVYFIHNYIKQVNLSAIIESGRLDGMSEFRIYNVLVMPMIKPSLFTMGIMFFIITWNNYLTPLTILQSPDKFTLPVTIAQMKAFEFAIDYGVQYMAIFLSLIPIIIVFLLFSKNIISGLSSGAVKE